MQTIPIPDVSDQATELVTSKDVLGYVLEDAKTHTGLRAITKRDGPPHTPAPRPTPKPSPSPKPTPTPLHTPNELVIPELATRLEEKERTETLEFEQPAIPAPAKTSSQKRLFSVMTFVMLLGLGGLAYIAFGTTPSQSTDPKEVRAFKDGVELADFPSAPSGDGVAGTTSRQVAPANTTPAAADAQEQPEEEKHVTPTPAPEPPQTSTKTKSIKVAKKATAAKPKRTAKPKPAPVQLNDEKSDAATTKTGAQKAPSGGHEPDKKRVSPKASDKGVVPADTPTSTEPASPTTPTEAKTDAPTTTSPQPIKRKRRRPIGLQ